MRFSFSFQQETPFNLQIEATELLVKVQEASRLSGSVRASFTPLRHVTSSSMEKHKGKLKSNNKSTGKGKEMESFICVVIFGGLCMRVQCVLSGKG